MVDKAQADVSKFGIAASINRVPTIEPGGMRVFLNWLKNQIRQMHRVGLQLWVDTF